MSAYSLSDEQLYALFHILSHEETYLEVHNLRIPGTLSHSGPPFVPASSGSEKPTGLPVDSGGKSPAPCPILHRLFADFATTLPGLKNVPAKFWPERAQPLVEALCEANLSESYDQGKLSLRKVLAIAISSVVEWAGRGRFGKLQRAKLARENGRYNVNEAEDVILAWDDLVQELVYSNLVDELWVKVAEKPALKDHSDLIQASHEYMLIIFASCLHYIFVVSPSGPGLLSLITRINHMVPYFVLRQTLKIGNVASMINGVVHIALAKVNVHSISKWMGMHKAEGEGMNLLQQIISTIMHWDADHMKKRQKALTQGTDVVNSEHIKAIEEYAAAGIKLQTEYREESERESKSIINVIMSRKSPAIEINEGQSKKAQEYLSLQLSIRDRKEMIRIFCHSEPDLLTSLIYDLVAAYEPMIRSIHKSVDLSSTLYDFEEFLKDLIKVAKIGDGPGARQSSVEDFVRLSKKHQGSLHKFLHQALKNAKDVAEWFRLYAKDALELYREQAEQNDPSSSDYRRAAGSFTKPLREAFARVSETQQGEIIKECDHYLVYLKEVDRLSKDQMRTIITNVRTGTGGDTQLGPGMFLADWQDLFYRTSITPSELHGQVRHGSNDTVKDATRVDVEGKRKGTQHSETSQLPVARPSIVAWSTLRTSFEEDLIRIDQGS